MTFFAFELMYLVAILGVSFRMSKEGAVCSGDYQAVYPDADAETDYKLVYYERSGLLIHVSGVILVTIGSMANFFGLYGSFYFYNQGEE